MWTTLGVALFAAVLLLIRDHRRLQAFTYTFGLTAILLLVLPLVPGLGRRINGAQIWIGIGGVSLQPREGAKVAGVGEDTCLIHKRPNHASRLFRSTKKSH